MSHLACHFCGQTVNQGSVEGSLNQARQLKDNKIIGYHLLIKPEGTFCCFNPSVLLLCPRVLELSVGGQGMLYLPRCTSYTHHTVHISNTLWFSKDESSCHLFHFSVVPLWLCVTGCNSKCALSAESFIFHSLKLPYYFKGLVHFPYSSPSV